ncbi:mitochondrial substrate carrier [Fusarium albosuccineum]|uniref:Mitochondrial substrate carrier n=1 Tax=Fusarium albosuccineum TaxID=1237068 RepID=A0A8H4KF71_9HYPO|nr:mitochondrial substrate carrier [Fusarium albosuccineum]
MANSESRDFSKWTCSPESFAKGFESMFVGDPEDASAHLERLFAPTYTQEVDGKVLNYSEFVDHIRHLRKVITAVKVKVNQFLRDGNQLAERHTVRVEFSNKPPSEFDVFLFGTVQEDGRMLSVVETTRQTEGHDGDRNLGKASS